MNRSRKKNLERDKKNYKHRPTVIFSLMKYGCGQTHLTFENNLTEALHWISRILIRITSVVKNVELYCFELAKVFQG